MDEFFILKNGFEKSGDFWFLKNEETAISVNYQKSRYSEEFYLNFGIHYFDYAPFSLENPQIEFRFAQFLHAVSPDFTFPKKAHNPVENIEWVKSEIESKIFTYIQNTLLNFNLLAEKFPECLVRLESNEEDIDFVHIILTYSEVESFKDFFRRKSK